MKPIDRVVIVVSAFITFLLASAGVTAAYWTLGGSFKLELDNVGLIVYALVELYLALVIANVAKRRPNQTRARRGE